MNTLRKLMNAASNRDLDLLLTFMKTPGLRSVVYRTNIDIIKYLSMGIKLFSTAKSNLVSPDKGGK